ncbi:MAG: aldehyde dehydrogenase family protein [Bdellovibrionales bacterium]|nr:aldehyde dehydrogenase family protein [Bdellovibrionales bacterium]
MMTSKDPRSAFEAARRSQPEIAALAIKSRVAFITSLRVVLIEERERIMDRIQDDTGKCRSDALMSEIFPILEHLEYLEKHAVRDLQDRKAHTPLAMMGKKSRVYFEPLGTILVISPWNYPFYQAIAPITTAFVGGNATVYKPSEHTPLTGLVEDLLAKAGFKAGWVNVVYGDGKTGAELIAQGPQKIFFTGSENTGKRIMAAAAEKLIPVELELGGKDPMIVFEDANVERAARGAAWGAFTNAGQSCTSVERLYVHESIYEPFKAALLREVGRMRYGVDKDGNSDMGRMTTDFQTAKVREHVGEALKAGANQLTGKEWDGKDLLIPPIVLENVKPDMKVARDETFGPVLPLFKFRTEEEAVRLANDSPDGLSASVWSKDLGRADRVARAIYTGNVSINNVMLSEGNHALPFGGVKNSGFGRYKGEWGLHSFCNVKAVLIDKDSTKVEANWYPLTAAKYQVFSRMMVALFSGGFLNFIRFAIAGMGLEGLAGKLGKAGRAPSEAGPIPPAATGSGSTRKASGASSHGRQPTVGA